MNKDKITYKKSLFYIALIFLILKPLYDILAVGKISKYNTYLECNMPYGSIAKSFFTLLIFSYFIYIIFKKLNTDKKTYSLPQWFLRFDVPTIKAYYIAIIITMFYVAFSLSILLPLKFDLSLILVMGTCVALFFNLLAICVIKVSQLVIFHYVEIDKNRNAKESFVTIGLILVFMFVLLLLKQTPCLVYKLCPEQYALYVFIGLTVFALVFHYPIIKYICK